MIFDKEKPDEAKIVGNYKPDHLYTANFRDGAGKFFNIVTLEDGNTTIEYHQPIPTRNRVKLTLTFIKEHDDIKEVSFKKFKHYKNDGWVEQDWEPGEPVSFSYFSFQKLIAFLQLLSDLDLASIDERRIALRDEKDAGIDNEMAKKLKAILIQPDGQKVIDELIKNGLITSKDIVNLGYRKKQVAIFDNLLHQDGYLDEYRGENSIGDTKPEKVWQHFFRNNEWIFGLGLDYRFLEILQNEAHIANDDVAGRDGAVSDSLLGYSNFTILVELKRPDTPLFENRKNRANSWKLSDDLIDSVSQILEQKASWQIKGETNASNNFNDKGELIQQKTLDPKSILIIGSDKQFVGTEKIKQIKLRTFELFRRDSRNIEIITYDELYERAKFIVSHTSNKSEKGIS